MITSIDIAQKRIAKFAEERDWQKFHLPKNLICALTVECSELLELVQWLSDQEFQENFKKDLEFKKRIEEEVADVFCYLVRLADLLEIDIFKALEEKMKKNAIKYPIDLVRGSSKKYNEYK